MRLVLLKCGKCELRIREVFFTGLYGLWEGGHWRLSLSSSGEGVDLVCLLGWEGGMRVGLIL